MANRRGEHPTTNKFHVGAPDGKHYWLTPPELYALLHREFGFTFDAAPHPLPDGFDGLTQPWGVSTYVNPPFGSILHDGKKKGPTAWARKAIKENLLGKTVVMVYPIDKWVLMLLAAGAEVRNLGDVRWLAPLAPHHLDAPQAPTAGALSRPAPPPAPTRHETTPST